MIWRPGVAAQCFDQVVDLSGAGAGDVGGHDYAHRALSIRRRGSRSSGENILAGVELDRRAHDHTREEECVTTNAGRRWVMITDINGSAETTNNIERIAAGRDQRTLSPLEAQVALPQWVMP